MARVLRLALLYTMLPLACTLLYTQPYSLRNLFYREEAIIHILSNMTRFYSSRLLSDYMDQVAPRLEELPLLHTLENEVKSLVSVHLSIIPT